MTRSDLLIINKTDLAPMVGASLEVMERDTRRMRGARPYVFTNMKARDGVRTIADFIIARGGLAPLIQYGGIMLARRIDVFMPEHVGHKVYVAGFLIEHRAVRTAQFMR